MKLSHITRAVIGVFLCSASMHLAYAAELAEGTVISAANIDKIKNDTFEGKTIGSMLSEKLEWRIRNTGMKIPMYRSKVIPLDPKWVAASRANVGRAKINPQTREVDGWQGGEPFPDISMTDPQAAEKVVWNWYLGEIRGDVAECRDFIYLFIDGKKGIHNTMVGEFTRYSMKGRLGGGPSTEGDGKGNELVRQLMYFKSPLEVKGLGTYTVQYDSSKVSDVWAYIPAVRRVRRLSGGAWMDPVGGTDELQDDIMGFNGRPSWYPAYKMLGKRWVFAVANGTEKVWNKSGNTDIEKYPLVDIGTAPFWNLNNDRYEPREVYVVEVTNPDHHPYSKKIMYMDTKFPRIHYSEAYNRRGDFWKMIEHHTYPARAEDGFHDQRTNGGLIVDFIRNHATVFVTDPALWRTNASSVKANNISLSVLEAGGR